MIRTDGDRSLKRKWFAKKQLASIKSLDIPAKSLVWDGFTFKAWQQGDLDGGYVKAPMGAVVLCSSPAGIKIATAENWAGGCTGYSDLYTLFLADGHIVTISGKTEEEMVALGFQTMRCKPDLRGAWCMLPDESATLIQQYSCTPSITPYKGGEAFNVTVTDMQFVDLNNSGIPDFPYQLLDSTLTGYCSNNSNLGGRRTTVLANGANNSWKTCQNLPEGNQTVWAEGFYDLSDGKFICGSQISETTDPVSGVKTPTVDHIYLENIVPAGAGMPDALRLLMLSTVISIIRPVGSYSFLNSTGERVFIHASAFLDSAIPIGGDDLTIAIWFQNNPEEEKWRVFLSVTIGDSVSLIHSGQFYTLLQSLALTPFTDSGVINWDKVATMLAYLMPWPNMAGVKNIYYAWKPHDSVMFHGHDDAVYTWTRAVGGVKFDTEGVHAATIQTPAEVTGSVGVRPDISYAGTDAITLEPLYFCSCNKIKGSILSTYYGSPFVGWTKLPDVPEYCTLMQVRPVKVSADLIFLIGVMRYEPPEVQAVYRFTSMKWSPDVICEWNLMMKLPFDVGTADNFATGLYGDSSMVKEMWLYPSPPPANPQNIVVPYNGYTRWQP